MLESAFGAAFVVSSLVSILHSKPSFKHNVAQWRNQRPPRYGRLRPEVGACGARRNWPRGTSARLPPMRKTPERGWRENMKVFISYRHGGDQLTALRLQALAAVNGLAVCETSCSPATPGSRVTHVPTCHHCWKSRLPSCQRHTLVGARRWIRLLHPESGLCLVGTSAQSYFFR